MKTRKRNQKGFTLIEALVAAAVFAFAISSILGVYVYVLKLNSRTRALRVLAQNARFMTEFFTKEVRNGHIDYTQYSGGTIPGSGTELWLINQDGESEHLYLYDATAATRVSNDSTCNDHVCNLMLEKPDASVTATALNSNGSRITNFTFLTSPSTDPFVGSTVNTQPHVTMVMQITANVGAKDQVKLDMQSSASELYYPAR